MSGEDMFVALVVGTMLTFAIVLGAAAWLTRR